MDTGRSCQITLHRAPGHTRPAPRSMGCGRGPGSRLPWRAGIQHSASMSFLRRQLRGEAGRPLPSLTLGGDSLGPEERRTYLSCSWCFPSDPNTSHSNLVIASVPRGAGPGPSWEGQLSKAIFRLRAKNCPNFQQKPSCWFFLPRAFHMHSSHSLDVTPQSPSGCTEPFPGSPFTFSILEVAAGSPSFP